jgi:hypothetical protein
MLQRSQLVVDDDLIIKILSGLRQSAQSRISWPVCDISARRQMQQLFHMPSTAYLPIGVWYNALMAGKTRFCLARNTDFAQGMVPFQSNRLSVLASFAPSTGTEKGNLQGFFTLHSADFRELETLRRMMAR